MAILTMPNPNPNPNFNSNPNPIPHQVYPSLFRRVLCTGCASWLVALHLLTNTTSPTPTYPYPSPKPKPKPKVRVSSGLATPCPTPTPTPSPVVAAVPVDVELSRGPVEARQLVLRDACYALRGSTPTWGSTPTSGDHGSGAYHLLAPGERLLGDRRLSSPLRTAARITGAGASGVGLPAAVTTVRSSTCVVL
jgi:hypothetical protein